MMPKLQLALLGAVMAAGSLFCQKPAQPPAANLFFIQMSDPQMGMIASNRDFAQETANFEFAIATANRLKPRFVIVTGDLVNKVGDPEQMAEYERISRRLDPSIHLYQVAGNHDVGNEPAPEDLERYRRRVGADFYSFREDSFYGIVLNSALLHSPQHAPEELRKQEAWLTSELGKAKQSGAAHIVLFLHHPPFMERADEPDQYFNIPLVRRKPLLDLLRQAGVHWVFSGHAHHNAEASDGALTVITTGPVGKPLGGARSGIRLVWVGGEGITHRYAEFGDLPATGAPPAVPMPQAK